MGATIATNQVLYNPLRRGIEWDLLPWCRKRNIPIIAYSPVEQGRLLDHPTLKTIAARHGATPAQIALAWLSRQAMMVIPKASRPEYIRENRQALEIHLADEDIKELDRAFPPPNSPSALAMR
jgi:diketogulonate reductase-like aldo/keto reductase